MIFLEKLCGFLLLISTLSFKVVFCQLNVDFEQPKDDNCNSTNIGLDGHIQFSKHSTTVPGDKTMTCIWTIKANTAVANSSKGIFLYAKSFYLEDGPSVKIEAIVDEVAHTYLDIFQGKLDAFTLFIPKPANKTFYVNVTMNVKPTVNKKPSSFQMYFRTDECKYLETVKGPGSLKLPLYQNGVDPFKCTLTLAPDSNDINDLRVRFGVFNVTKDAFTINGTIRGKTGPFDSSNPPPNENLSKDNVILSLSVTNTSVANNITVLYDLTTQACTDVLKLPNPITSLVSPPTDDNIFYQSQKFNCLWLLESDINTIISFELKSIIFTSSSDQIIILDGPNQSSPFITSITQADLKSWRSKFIQTSGNQAWVSLTTPLALKSFKVDLGISQRKTGGFSSHPTQLINQKVEDDGVYLYKLEEGKQVELSFNKQGNNIPVGGDIKIFKDLSRTESPIAIITKDNLDTVVSMSNTMAVVLEKFQGGSINATISTRDPGCYAQGSGNGGAYSLTGQCNERCSWKIPPMVNSTDEIIFHFTSVIIDSNDTLKITKQDLNRTSIVEVKGPITDMPDLIVPASDGAIVDIVRANCTTSKTLIQASYAIHPACHSEYKTKGGQAIQIISPNYPNNYPIFSNCTMRVSRESNMSLLHLSFSNLKLALLNHQIVVSELKTDGNKTDQSVLAIFNSTTTTLPNDFLVKNDVLINFIISVKSATDPLTSASGFNVTVINMDNGGVVSDKVGNVTSPGYPAKVKLGSLFAYVVSVPAINSSNTQNIISLKAGNLTKEDELKKFVTIYDGPSIRDETLSNFTGDELLSRSNTVIFLYKHQNLTQDGPPMLFNFQVYACNSSLMCDNKICMHEDWICNGKNDCGDYSDEKNCQGFVPGPTPSPLPPTPKTAGTSTTALTLGILAALIIGILLGVAAPAAYRRIAGNRFSSYSTFSNTPE